MQTLKFHLLTLYLDCLLLTEELSGTSLTKPLKFLLPNESQWSQHPIYFIHNG